MSMKFTESTCRPDEKPSYRRWQKDYKVYSHESFAKSLQMWCPCTLTCTVLSEVNPLHNYYSISFNSLSALAGWESRLWGLSSFAPSTPCLMSINCFVFVFLWKIAALYDTIEKIFEAKEPGLESYLYRTSGLWLWAIKISI